MGLGKTLQVIAFILSHRVFCGMFLLSAILVIGGFSWAYVALSPITQPLIIHFNDHIGINQIGGMSGLFRASILGFLIVATNAFLAFTALKTDEVYGYAIGVATLFLALLLFVGFVAIIRVN